MLKLNRNPTTWQPYYSRWRHGGSYVTNIRYPTGACGCVSNNFPDGKWRIVCDKRRIKLNCDGDFTFPTRDAAARAEYEMAVQSGLSKPADNRH
jgi:hypothetical protein